MMEPPKDTIELLNLVSYLFRLMNSLMMRVSEASHNFLTATNEESILDIHARKSFVVGSEVTSLLYSCRLLERYPMNEVAREISFVTTSSLPCATETYQPDLDLQILECRSMCRFFLRHQVSSFEKQKSQFVRLCDSLQLLDDAETMDISELKDVLTEINVRPILRQLLARLHGDTDEIREDTESSGRCMTHENETKIIHAFQNCPVIKHKLQIMERDIL